MKIQHTNTSTERIATSGDFGITSSDLVRKTPAILRPIALKKPVAPTMENFLKKLHALLGDDDAFAALSGALQVKSFARGEHYVLAGETKPYCCIVVRGLVGSYTYDDYGQRTLHQVTLPEQSFTGTKHEYSNTTSGFYIEFFQASELLLLHLDRLRSLQRQHGVLIRWTNILRQRRATQNEQKLLVMALPATERYAALQRVLPIVCQSLNNRQLSEYLAINPKTLYRSRRKLLGR